MEKRYVTLAEAAAIASTSLDTIRRRLKSGEVERAKTNERGVYVDLASLRAAFDLPHDAGQDEGAKAAEAEQTLKAAIKGLQEKLGEMRLAQAQTDLKHRDEIAGFETRLAIAQTLADQRQAEIERLHSIVTASAQQLPSMEALLVEERDRHRAALKVLQEQMREEGARAAAELAALKARPWWKRLAG